MQHSSVQAGFGGIAPQQAQEIKERVYAIARQLDIMVADAPRPNIDTPVTEKRVLAILNARRRRSRYFDADLFADPAWDILLELYAASIAQRRMSVNSLCLGAGVPATTALRWIKMLERRGMIQRQDDPMDRRRVFLNLSPSAVLAMDELLRSVPQNEPLL